MQFEDEKRLQIHKKVHGRKPKISEYGSPEFSQDRLRGQITTTYCALVRSILVSSDEIKMTNINIISKNPDLMDEDWNTNPRIDSSVHW